MKYFLTVPPSFKRVALLFCEMSERTSNNFYNILLNDTSYITCGKVIEGWRDLCPLSYHKFTAEIVLKELV